MASITFTINLQHHVHAPDMQVSGTNVKEALDLYFQQYPKVKTYVVDDQGAVRHHMLILVDGLSIRDRQKLSDPLTEGSVISVFQALSGG